MRRAKDRRVARRSADAARALRLASTAGDAAALRRTLHDHVVMTAGTGRHRGSAAVADALLRTIDIVAPAEVIEHPVNGGTGILLSRDDRVVAVIVFDLRGRKITELWIVHEPERLAAFNR
jgi:hypothetical protein